MKKMGLSVGASVFTVVLALGLIVGPTAAATSDVGLTIDPRAVFDPSLGVGLTGTVSCRTTSVSNAPVEATLRQGSTELTSLFGEANCDPSVGTGFWNAVIFSFSGELHPGQASVDVTLTLADGTVVTTTGSVVLTLPNKPNFRSEHVDITEFREDISNFCGFPVQERDVGLQQVFTFQVGGLGLVEHFVGTSTFTNLATGHSVELRVVSRVTFTVEGLVFSGLDYEIRTADRQLVSAGRGVVDATGEQATPHLAHLSDVLCGLLA